MKKEINPKDYISLMTPMSDILSQVMFENNTELVEYIIRTIIGIDDLKVIKVEV